MTLRIAINGFGRIGRLTLRALFENASSDFDVVAINDLTPLEGSGHLLQYDSVHGRFPGTVCIKDKVLRVNGHDITVLSLAKPEDLPWADMNIDIVFECSGRFTTREESAAHLKAGAKRVLVSAPTTKADLTVVYGVNHDCLKEEHLVVSNASCTTNCLAPMAKVLHENFGIERGFMTTIHAYTGDQRLVDTGHSDLRRSRAAALSMIPTSTGAARAVGLVLPALAGKIDGAAIRVPTPNVSVVDFKCTLGQDTDISEINQAFEKAATGSLAGILGYVTDPLVSCDFNHDRHSCQFDGAETVVLEKRFARVMGWYDNEWGFSNRMLDVARHMGRFL